MNSQAAEDAWAEFFGSVEWITADDRRLFLFGYQAALDGLAASRLEESTALDLASVQNMTPDYWRGLAAIALARTPETEPEPHGLEP